MMRQRSSLIISLVLGCSLLAAGVTLAQRGPAPGLLGWEVDEMAQPIPSSCRFINPVVDQATVASGGRYRLLRPESVDASPPPSAEVGCCCTYLPCTLKAFH